MRDFARNQLLPRLDVIASGSLDGFSGQHAKSIGNLGDTEGYHWFVGLQIEYPLGNRLARHQLKQRNLELKQAAFDQRLLTLLIATDVR